MYRIKIIYCNDYYLTYPVLFKSILYIKSFNYVVVWKNASMEAYIIIIIKLFFQNF